MDTSKTPSGLYVVEDDVRPDGNLELVTCSTGPDWITERIAVGTDSYLRDDSALEALRRAGVTHILNVRSELREVGATRFGEFRFCEALTHDDGEKKPTEWFRKGIEFALLALATESSSKIYVHCSAGVNRGPSMAYAILRAMGHSANTALYLVKLARPIAEVAYKSDADWAVFRLGYVASFDG